MEKQPVLGELLAGIKVIPVIAIDDADDAVPLARALFDGGVRAMEITFRTPAAETALRNVHAASFQLVLGAGTLRTPRELERARYAGAAFGVSPGATEALAQAARAFAFPWLPGAATPSEVMRLADAGFSVLKLFPASLVLLDALTGPFPELRWVPTGGVTVENAAAYMGRSSVLAVSGTWIAPRALIAQRNFEEIRKRAQIAVRITSALGG